MAQKYPNAYLLWVSAVVIVLDQVTKQLIVRNLEWFDIVPVTGFLNLTHLRNTGAAFSSFSELPPMVFITIGIAVSIWIIWWMRSNPFGERLVAASLALILGGALGNVIDRATRGHVVDFIDFHIGDWHYAAFNVADTAITLGAALMILDVFLSWKRERGT